jgi:CBS domain containing-hemolysin-like protein
LETYYWLAVVVAFAGAFFFSMALGALGAFSAAKFDRLRVPEDSKKRIRGYLDRRANIWFTCRLCDLCFRAALVAAIVSWSVNRGSAWGAVLLVFLAAVFASGILPRHLSARSPERFLGFAFPVLDAVSIVLSPLTVPLRAATRAVGRLAGMKSEPSEEEQAEEQILAAVHEGEMEGVLEEEEKEMIESIIEFKDVTVAEIMTPRTDMVCLEAGASFEAALDFVKKSGFSRIPVIEQYLDNVVGILYAKDLVGACEHDKQPALKQLLRPPTFVPETKKIAELLAQFQKGKVHMAIVLDEYGGVAGLVTIEDVVEEIVGEIEDEFDIDGRQLIKPSDDGGAEVSARAKVKEVNEALGINLPESEDYDTISGLISSRLDRIPGAGESLDVDNVHITILEADPRRVKRVAVKVKKEES